MTDALANLFGGRYVFELDPAVGADADPRVFEERVTIWQASDFDTAIELAEAEAVDYATILDAKYLVLAQAYRIEGTPTQCTEVFPLIRRSEFAPRDYLNAFFDTDGSYNVRSTRDRPRHCSSVVRW